MRKKFLFLFLMLFSFFLFACKVTDPDLNAPKNLGISNGVLTWDAVDGAESYIVVVGEDRYEVTVTTYDLKSLDLPEGTYQVSVIAVKGEKNSDPSDTKSYVVISTNLQLLIPTNLKVVNGQVSWDAVLNAVEYEVIIDGETFKVSSNSFNLENLFLTTGTYEIKVRALAGTIASEFSNTVEYELNPKADPNALYLSFLAAINSNYLPDMIKDDFEDEDEYEDYLDSVEIATALSQIMADSMLSEEDAEEIFSSLVAFFKNKDRIQGAVSLQTQLQTLAILDQNPEWFAYVIYEFAIYAADYIIADAETSITELLVEKAEYESQVNEILSSTDYLRLYDNLRYYTDKDRRAALDDFLANIERSNDEFLSINLKNMAHNISYGWDDRDYYVDDDDLYMFYQIFKNAQASDDLEFLQDIMSVIDQGDFPLLTYYYSKKPLADTIRSIEREEKTISTLNAFKSLLSEQKEICMQSVEMVVGYLLNIYKNLPNTIYTAIDAINGKTLTLTEIVIFKDVLIGILQENLPSADDFALMWEMQFYIADILSELEIDDYLEQVQAYGDLQHLLLDLLLEAGLYIDEEIITEVMQLADGIYTEGYYDEENDVYVDSVTDYHKLIDLIRYVYDTYQAFRTENAASFILLEQIPYFDMTSDLVNLYMDICLNSLTYYVPSHDEENIEMVVAIVNDCLPDLISILENGGPVLNELLDVFSSTEAVFFHNLVTFIQETKNDESISNVVAAVQTLIDDWRPYHEIIVEEIDQDDFETLLSLVGNILKNVFKELGYDDFETVIDEIDEYCLEALMNIFSLYDDIYQAMDSQDFSQLFVDMEPKYAARVAAIMVVDAVLTEDNKTLINETVAIVINNIIGNEGVLDIMEFPRDKYYVMKERIPEQIGLMMDAISEVMDLDFTNLSDDDKTLIIEVASFFGFQGEGESE